MSTRPDKKLSLGLTEEEALDLVDVNKQGSTRSIAIHQFCIECMGWQSGLVTDCTHKHCVLYTYRMGPGNTDCTVEDSIKRSLKLSPEGK